MVAVLVEMMAACGGHSRRSSLITMQCGQATTSGRLAKSTIRLTLSRALKWCPGPTCRQTLDRRGDHLTSCPRTGYLKLRATPLERCWAQVFREAGVRVVENQFLRDLGIPGVRPSDSRKIEVIAYGLPLFHGVLLCVDATMVSPLTSEGVPHHNSPGKAVLEAEKEKQRTYHELQDGQRGKLLVGVERKTSD